MSNYATVDDVQALWRKLSLDEQDQAQALIPIVCDILRSEAKKVGKNLDNMVDDETLSANVVKSVIVDIVVRTIQQNASNNSSNLTQESQSVNGYTWSGSYANTGGGVGVLKKDLSRLGLRRQRYGVLDMYGMGKYCDD